MITNIIAYGEVTGHKHQIMSPSMDELDSRVDEKGDIFVRNQKGTITVEHDEHGTIVLPQNEWICISRQREYDPVAEHERRVAD
jgi:hypothetical protein